MAKKNKISKKTKSSTIHRRSKKQKQVKINRNKKNQNNTKKKNMHGGNDDVDTDEENLGLDEEEEEYNQTFPDQSEDQDEMDAMLLDEIENSFKESEIIVKEIDVWKMTKTDLDDHLLFLHVSSLNVFINKVEALKIDRRSNLLITKRGNTVYAENMKFLLKNHKKIKQFQQIYQGYRSKNLLKGIETNRTTDLSSLELESIDGRINTALHSIQLYKSIYGRQQLAQNMYPFYLQNYVLDDLIRQADWISSKYVSYILEDRLHELQRELLYTEEG